MVMADEAVMAAMRRRMGDDNDWSVIWGGQKERIDADKPTDLHGRKAPRPGELR